MNENTSPVTLSLFSLSLTIMTAQDDTRVYLKMFKGIASACAWPRSKYRVCIQALLTGEAHQSGWTVWILVLDHVGLSPKRHCWYFHSMLLLEGYHLFSFSLILRLLKLLSERGLAKPEEVIKWVALEQFLSHFPTGTLEWVQCHQPGSLAKATQLVEEASKN